MNNKDIQLSKSLSWLLRHGAVKEGFKLSPEGYLEVNKILQHKLFRGRFNTLDIERVVCNNDKQRFKLRRNLHTNCLEIKANQGHTISDVTDADLTPITEPKYKTIIHGTYLKCWQQIKNEGLSRMKRKHVHLAKGLPDDAAVISGLRKDADVHIYIDVAKALADGIKFFESENGVILTSGNDKGYLEPKYFEKVVNIRTAISTVMEAGGTGGAGATGASSSSPRHAARRRHEREPPDQHPNTPNNRRILVSGFPGYTQTQDLVEVFSRFGNVRVDKWCGWAAVLTFACARAAAAAVLARVHVYGHFLCVRAYSPAALDLLRPLPATPKRDFPMSKQKGVIVDPKKVDLTGDFHCQLDKVLSAVRLTQDNVKALSQLYSDLEQALQVQWPGCKAIPFGSITTGLGIKTSDADCFINIPGQFRVPNGNFVNKAKRVLVQHPDSFAEILAIPRANTPIVKFFHIPTATNCDVTFKTPLGAQNSRLVAFLLHSDPRLLPMAVLIKYWAKVHDLSGTGKLTNYALTLMIVFYLQQLPISLLPSVAWLQADPAVAFLVDGWNTGFMSNPARLPASSNTSGIAELLGGFFEYYAKFNFDDLVICPYFGAPIKKEVFKDTAKMPNEFNLYKMNVLSNYVMPIRFQTAICVQDPFEQSHNVASTITNRLAADLKCFFVFAADAYEKEKLNGCQNFLTTILLEKPKLVKGKTHPEYRVNLFPKLLNTIIEFEWKPVVRDLVMDIFENLLKIKLAKIEETVNPDTRKEKEKYAACLNKAIWKRKAFSKLYSIVDMTFDQRQEKITEEIINADKQELGIQFLVIVTYCSDPKSAVVAVRLVSGDIYAFRDFGKFIMSSLQTWFTQMLKHYLMSHCHSGTIDDSIELDNNENGVESDYDDEDTLNSKSESLEQEPVRDKTKPVDTTAKETVTSTIIETKTNHADECVTDDAEKLTNSTETLTENAETLPTDSELTTRDAATLINNADVLIKALNINGSPTPEVSDVAVACAQK